MIGLEHYDAVQKLCEERCRSVLKEVDSKEFEIMLAEAYEKKIMSKKRLYDGLSDKERLEEKLRYLQHLQKIHEESLDRFLLHRELLLKEDGPAKINTKDTAALQDTSSADVTWFDKYITPIFANANNLSTILNTLEYVPYIGDAFTGAANFINNSVESIPDPAEKQEAIADIGISKLEINIAMLNSALALSTGTASEAVTFVLDVIVHVVLALYYAGRCANNFTKFVVYALDTESYGSGKILNYLFRCLMDYVDCCLQIISLLEAIPELGLGVQVITIPVKNAQDLIKRIGMLKIGGATIVAGFITAAISYEAATEFVTGLLGVAFQVRGGGLPGGGVFDPDPNASKLNPLETYKKLANISNVDFFENFDPKAIKSEKMLQDALDNPKALLSPAENIVDIIQKVSVSIKQITSALRDPSIKDSLEFYTDMIGRKQDIDDFYKAIDSFHKNAESISQDFVNFAKLKGTDITNVDDMYKVIASKSPELSYLLKNFGGVNKNDQVAQIAVALALLIKKNQMIDSVGPMNKRKLASFSGDQNKIKYTESQITDIIQRDILKDGAKKIRQLTKINADLKDFDTNWKAALKAIDDIVIDPKLAQNIHIESIEALDNMFFERIVRSFKTIAPGVPINPNNSRYSGDNRLTNLIQDIENFKNAGGITDQQYVEFSKIIKNLLEPIISNSLIDNMKKQSTSMVGGVEKMLSILVDKHSNTISKDFPESLRWFNTSGANRRGKTFELSEEDYIKNHPYISLIVPMPIIPTDVEGYVGKNLLYRFLPPRWRGNTFELFNNRPYEAAQRIYSLRVNLYKLAYLRFTSRTISKNILLDFFGNPCVDKKLINMLKSWGKGGYGSKLGELLEEYCNTYTAVDELAEETKEIYEEVKQKSKDIAEEFKDAMEELTTEGEPVQIGGKDTGSGEEVNIGGGDTEATEDKQEEEGEEVNIGG